MEGLFFVFSPRLLNNKAILALMKIYKELNQNFYFLKEYSR